MKNQDSFQTMSEFLDINEFFKAKDEWIKRDGRCILT